jgi:hypothetical protein
VARVQTALTEVTFTIDMTAPVSSVLTPANDASYNASLGTFQGQAMDDLSGIPANGAHVWIRDVGLIEDLEWPTTYWNGSAWQESASPIWLQVTPANPGGMTTPWTYPKPALADGHRYAVQSRATDIAGNVEVPAAVSYFNYDVLHPTATIGNPPNGGALSTLAEITGSYVDPYPGSALPDDAVKISIRQDFGSQLYWKGAATGWEGTSEYWLDATETLTQSSTDTGRGADWSFSDVPAWQDQQIYRVRAKAVDSAGNAQASLGDAFIAVSTFTFDASAPQTLMYAPVAPAAPR